MSRTDNYYSAKRIISLSKRMFIFSGGRCSGKSQLAYDLCGELARTGKIILIIRKNRARSLNIKASRKTIKRRGVK